MALTVRPGLEIPDTDLEVAFIRSSGPGGQNVNKVAIRRAAALRAGAECDAERETSRRGCVSLPANG